VGGCLSARSRDLGDRDHSATLQTLSCPERGRSTGSAPFEVLKTLVAGNAYLSERELANKRDAIAIGDEDLTTRLREFGVSIEGLDHPSNGDYPI
jgi:hypothetical protein